MTERDIDPRPQPGDEEDTERVVLPDGTVLGPDDLDRIAQEAEAPIPDDAEVRVVGAFRDVVRGRPSLSGTPGKHSPRVQFRVTPAQREQLQRLAERENKTPSEIAREALEERLASA